MESDPDFLELYTSANEDIKKDDMLFIKNIENVQGDERDIIIFSIGYAKDIDKNLQISSGDTIMVIIWSKQINICKRAQHESYIMLSINHMLQNIKMMFKLLFLDNLFITASILSISRFGFFHQFLLQILSIWTHPLGNSNKNF